MRDSPIGSTDGRIPRRTGAATRSTEARFGGRFWVGVRVRGLAGVDLADGQLLDGNFWGVLFSKMQQKKMQHAAKISP